MNGVMAILAACAGTDDFEYIMTFGSLDIWEWDGCIKVTFPVDAVLPVKDHKELGLTLPSHALRRVCISPTNVSAQLTAASSCTVTLRRS